MKVSDFNFDLPEELIAQYPAARRQDSRMLVMDRKTGECTLRGFANFAEYLRPGDCLVLNDTKVLKARLWGHRAGTGGRVQAFVLRQVNADSWECLLRPGRRLPPGSVVELDGGGTFTVQEKNEGGTFQVKFETDDVYALMERAGQIPLPPYITRQPTAEDQERYQTVYADHLGAVAAPTAGLHFTKEILSQLEAKGVRIVRLTLHVGAGTFKPVDEENVEDHRMHSERYILTPEAADIINGTHDAGGRVFCVGTTTVRVLETCNIPGTRHVAPGTGATSIFLYPPYRAIVPDCLLTNFHLPQSTLIMLVCTFADQDKVFHAYRLAIENRLRFYSYGDCMLLV
ncbi:MAG: tRNA preQ1(34) S-adenosylmethionine ribosyltransferase-isomerase QueA [Victivallales bacterium]|nr:tRNA preQ1(34) S-adenosylmethionine ribosyltransferase-isomerase QueA [Victivallales bacterium]